jgi:hypothetical protein
MLLCALAAACGGGSASGADAGDGDRELPEPSTDLERDILATALAVHVENRAATAVIELAPAAGTGASFEVGDLEIFSVRDAAGELLYRVEGERLDVGVPAPEGQGGDAIELTIEYRYQHHEGFRGASSQGYTLLWPYYCGNLFPCRSDPAGGLRFALELSGVPAGADAIYPASIPTDAPSYMPAWAIGEYTHVDLGQTAAGTRVGAYHLPGQDAATAAGTANLREVFEWLETTIGPYPFGDEVASVAVSWGAGAYGGMEHHPLWHVAGAAMADQEIHAHEAAHGWFGNGIRIACWEDFVLSEGTVSYLAARALDAAAGSETGDQVWASYQQRLDSLQASPRNKIAWPEGCNQLDILEDGLFGAAPYMKGAFFFRALEQRIGAPALDAALAAFFAERSGRAARMQDLLDLVAAEADYDPTPCALAWLRSESVPSEPACP